MQSQTPRVRVARGRDEARETVLQRVPLDRTALPAEMQAALERAFGRPLSPEEAVAEIIQRVSQEGDLALWYYTKLLDGVEPTGFRVSSDDIERALNEADPELLSALRLAVDRIRRFHQRQPAASWLAWEGDGALGQMIRPLQRVGIYVPGGTAPLASTVVMTAVPAQVAGVGEIVLCSPPQGQSGLPHLTVLAAASVAGVDAVYGVGGAQAIAAMAFGTESIPRVDKIVGPGNLFVVLAKRALFGVVGIESLPGPTETLIIADETAHPRLVAADLLAQAEHVMASAILITPSEALAAAVRAEVESQLSGLDTAEAARQSLSQRGGMVICRDLDEAVELANEYAPEHLCLAVAKPWELLPLVRNAGGVFLGEHSSEALGDYVVGPSHVMPTGGTARFASPLNVWDFVKITSVFALGRGSAGELGPAAATLSAAEGLSAHCSAIRMRRDCDLE